MNRTRLVLLVIALVVFSLEIVKVSWFSSESSRDERSHLPSLNNTPLTHLYDRFPDANLTRYLDYLLAITDPSRRIISESEETHAFIAPVEFKAMADMYLSHFCSKGFTYPLGSEKFGKFCWYSVDLPRMVCCEMNR
jgi:hypothetical protein